jgi:hypothetical protein
MDGYDIQSQRKEIYEEIHEIRNSVNTHLDKLQETLIGSINKTVDDVTLQLVIFHRCLIFQPLFLHRLL